MGAAADVFMLTIDVSAPWVSVPLLGPGDDGGYLDNQLTNVNTPTLGVRRRGATVTLLDGDSELGETTAPGRRDVVYPRHLAAVGRRPFPDRSGRRTLAGNVAEAGAEFTIDNTHSRGAAPGAGAGRRQRLSKRQLDPRSTGPDPRRQRRAGRTW